MMLIASRTFHPIRVSRIGFSATEPAVGMDRRTWCGFPHEPILMFELTADEALKGDVNGFGESDWLGHLLAM